MRFPPQLPCVVACLFLLVGHPHALRAADEAGQLRPKELRCEALTDPLGIGTPLPRLSWINESARRSEMQTAYQVLVAASADALARNTGDLWDSGQVPGDASTGVVYAGKPLASRAAACWKVRTWDRDGHPSAWSDPASWTLGLLSPTDWQAKWIDGTSDDPMASVVQVTKATYGPTDGQGETKDVTALVADLLAKGDKNVHVTNADLGGDPAHNHRKQLVLDAVVRGRPRHVVLPEDSPLRLDDEAAPVCLRRSFRADAPVQRATLYVTALGLYDARLNGQRVGDHVLAPDWTDYRKRVRYQAYDVTALLRPGENVLAATLGNGWYSGHIGNGGFQQYGTVPTLLAQLEITRADGTVERIATDNSWKTHSSPTLASDFMLGETYDARAELPGWNAPGYDDHAWTAARVRDEKPRSLDSQVSPPVRQTAERRPIALAEPAPGHWTYDLGQNMVGVVRLKVTAPAGTVVTLHHAEMLKADGTVYTANLRGAPSVDTYTCKGGGEETWQPKFTFHGFRYVELTGLPAKPAADAVTGIVLGTDNPVAGSLTTSNPLLNQLVSNIDWGARGNYLSVPTDCPQRDERLGWMGDAEVFVRTGTDVYDIEAFFTKWLVDVDDAQTPAGAFTDVSPAHGDDAGVPAWGDAGVICPWTLYEAYGDRRLLETNLPAMIRWVEWCRAHSTNGLRDNAKDRGHDYGDWLSHRREHPQGRDRHRLLRLQHASRRPGLPRARQRRRGRQI